LQQRGAALATSSDNPDSRIEKILMERRMLEKLRGGIKSRAIV